MTAALNIETLALSLTLNLLLSLTDFGLDPQDWAIVESPVSNHLVIAHKCDPEFQMIGEVKNNKWNSLQVISV